MNEQGIHLLSRSITVAATIKFNLMCIQHVHERIDCPRLHCEIIHLKPQHLFQERCLYIHSHHDCICPSECIRRVTTWRSDTVRLYIKKHFHFNSVFLENIYCILYLTLRHISFPAVLADCYDTRALGVGVMYASMLQCYILVWEIWAPCMFDQKVYGFRILNGVMCLSLAWIFKKTTTDYQYKIVYTNGKY